MVLANTEYPIPNTGSIVLDYWPKALLDPYLKFETLILGWSKA
jgi:hypothetical protein